MKSPIPEYLKKYLLCENKQRDYLPHSSAQELFEWFQDKELSELDKRLLGSYIKYKAYGARLDLDRERLIVSSIAPHLTNKSRWVIVQLLGNRHARRYIRGIRLQSSLSPRPDADTITTLFAHILSASVTDIVNVHVYNCRYCHGEGHRYQWILSEYEEEMQKFTDAAAKGDFMPPPNYAGGMGFLLNNTPNADCPKCGGHGVNHVIINDTRDLSLSAKLLLSEITQDRHGCVKIKHADKIKVAMELGKILGIYKTIQKEAQSELTNDSEAVDLPTTELLRRVQSTIKPSLH